MPSELIERFETHLHVQVQELFDQPAVTAAIDAGTTSGIALSSLEQLLMSNAHLRSSSKDEGLQFESQDAESQENFTWRLISKRAAKLCGLPEDHFAEDEMCDHSESSEATSSASDLHSKEEIGLLRKVSSSPLMAIAQDALRLPRSNAYKYESLRDLIPLGGWQGDAHGPKHGAQCRQDSASPRIEHLQRNWPWLVPDLRLPRRRRRFICLGLACCLPFAIDEVEQGSP